MPGSASSSRWPAPPGRRARHAAPGSLGYYGCKKASAHWRNWAQETLEAYHFRPVHRTPRGTKKNVTLPPAR